MLSICQILSNYIPIDISTMLFTSNLDPDIQRESFAGIEINNKKHNALWDAMIIKKIFYKLKI